MNEEHVLDLEGEAEPDEKQPVSAKEQRERDSIMNDIYNDMSDDSSEESQEEEVAANPSSP